MLPGNREDSVTRASPPKGIGDRVMANTSHSIASLHAHSAPRPGHRDVWKHGEPRRTALRSQHFTLHVAGLLCWSFLCCTFQSHHDSSHQFPFVSQDHFSFGVEYNWCRALTATERHSRSARKIIAWCKNKRVSSSESTWDLSGVGSTVPLGISVAKFLYSLFTFTTNDLITSTTPSCMVFFLPCNLFVFHPQVAAPQRTQPVWLPIKNTVSSYPQRIPPVACDHQAASPSTPAHTSCPSKTTQRASNCD
ncbi:hypothetical protein FN846DRAFT_960106 [Sphaerosporella brunnea]|uniref:Uncharacterized protein n=1 Tax=Sphaerosporella brunnea TaxID=1250544 RepID=A0A5J5EPH7_9PEZI|nr:hypothetical protein FN846DRAFT_960106 [Sphaerosporella brunnea]